MIREWANKDLNEQITAALRPPANWRDPSTGLPAGWETEDEQAQWAEFERAMHD